MIKAFIPNLDNEEQFDKVIENDNRIKLLEKEIKSLENKIKKEKQMNRKVDLNKILLEKQKELLIVSG